MDRLRQLNEMNKSSYNFGNLINKYSHGSVKIIQETEGYYDENNGGKWVPGATVEVTISPAAIVPLNKDDLNFIEGGTYNSDYRKLYCYKKISKGAVVEHTHSKGDINNYKMINAANYGDFDSADDGLFIYVLKRGDRD